MSLAQRAPAVLPFLFAALIVLLLSLAVLSQADPLRTFPSLDSGYYLYIGQQVLQGKIPYLDLWESKPPGIFYINALGLLLGRGTRWGIWVLELFSILLSAGLGFYLLQRRYGFFPALFGSVAWIWGLQGVLQGGNLTEEYSLPFNFAAALLFALSLHTPQKKIFPFLIGITFGFSFLLRANNTGLHMALVLAWILHAVLQREFRLLTFRLLWSGIAVLFVLALAGLILFAQGALAEAIDAAILFNLSMSSSGNLLNGIKSGFGFIGIPAGFALLGYLLLIFVANKREAWILFLLILLPLEAFLSTLSGRGYPHYYITWMPALAILSAHLLAELPGLHQRLERRRAWVSLGILLVCFLVLSAPLSDITTSLRQVAVNRAQGIEIDDALAAYLRRNTDPDDSVLVWGGRLAYNYMARRESPSSVLFYPLLVDSPISTRLSDRFMDDVLASPPQMIVDTHALNQDLLPALNPQIRQQQQGTGKLWASLPHNIEIFYEFVRNNYVLETEIGAAQIYRLNAP
jgi:hypothetical protein